MRTEQDIIEVFAQYRGIHYAFNEEILIRGTSYSDKLTLNRYLRSIHRRTKGFSDVINPSHAVFEFLPIKPELKITDMDPVSNSIMSYNSYLLSEAGREISSSVTNDLTDSYDSASSDDEEFYDELQDRYSFGFKEDSGAGQIINAINQAADGSFSFNDINRAICNNINLGYYSNKNHYATIVRGNAVYNEELYVGLHISIINAQEFKKRLFTYHRINTDILHHSSFLPLHPVMYAVGIKDCSLQVSSYAISASYDLNGRPHNPYLGEYIVSIVCNLKQDNLFDIKCINKQRKNQKKGIIGNKFCGEAENEVIVIGGENANIVASNYKQIIKMPRFDKQYKNSFLRKYGISKNKFYKIKTIISHIKEHIRHEQYAKESLLIVEEYIKAIVAEHHINNIAPTTAVKLVLDLSTKYNCNVVLKYKDYNSNLNTFDDKWHTTDKMPSSYASHDIVYKNNNGLLYNYKTIKCSKYKNISDRKQYFDKLDNLFSSYCDIERTSSSIASLSDKVKNMTI